jgi:hypothetical protein
VGHLIDAALKVHMRCGVHSTFTAHAHNLKFQKFVFIDAYGRLRVAAHQRAHSQLYSNAKVLFASAGQMQCLHACLICTAEGSC